MPIPLSEDLRKRVAKKLEKNIDPRKISRKYDIGIATVYRWKKRWSESGSGDIPVKEHKRLGHSHKIKDLDLFRGFVEANPELTQREIAAHYGCTKTVVARRLKRLKFTKKKRLLVTQREKTKREPPF